MFMSMKLDKRLFQKMDKTGNRTLTMQPYYREESKKHRRLKLVKRHIRKQNRHTKRRNIQQQNSK